MCGQHRTPALGCTGRWQRRLCELQWGPRNTLPPGRHSFQTAGGVTHLLPHTHSCPAGRDTQPDAIFATADTCTLDQSEICVPDRQNTNPTHSHSHTHMQNWLILHHLCVKYMWISQIAELDQSIKLLRECKCIWTERIPAERWPSKFSHVLYFLEVGLLEGFTHFLNTMRDKMGHTLGHANFKRCWMDRVEKGTIKLEDVFACLNTICHTTADRSRLTAKKCVFVWCLEFHKICRKLKYWLCVYTCSSECWPMHNTADVWLGAVSFWQVLRENKTRSADAVWPCSEPEMLPVWFYVWNRCTHRRR